MKTQDNAVGRKRCDKLADIASVMEEEAARTAMAHCSALVVQAIVGGGEAGRT